ncbi:hypothetical protein [Leptolyngbya sp. KIOST-1]|uniref:hypothetical protein n=1 Tax=Leptolyngbya sp. KIOST-1 TaxID=1229172 RepID=UPI0012E010AF|nr:hypothetical protein [Leptolyngbya sp. KIOST-1]
MTAFTSAQLPTGAFAITTLEELVTWSTAVLSFNNSTDSYTEAPNTNRIYRYIQPQLRVPDGELIIVNRAMIVVNETAAQNLPVWKRVREFSQTVIPTSFRSP